MGGMGCSLQACVPFCCVCETNWLATNQAAMCTHKVSKSLLVAALEIFGKSTQMVSFCNAKSVML